MHAIDSPGRLDIDLPEIVDLPAASMLRDRLLDAFGDDSDADIVLKADRVQRMSTAAVQVILAADRAFAGTGRRLVLDTPSAPLAEAFGRLGLDRNFRKLT